MSHPPGSWTRDATQRYLNAVPLPHDLVWPHRDDDKDRPVQPAHGTVIGYGKWLRETPYFPGLFELAHDLLELAPEDFDAAWLPAELQRLRASYDQQPQRPGEHLAQKIRRLHASASQPSLF